VKALTTKTTPTTRSTRHTLTRSATRQVLTTTSRGRALDGSRTRGINVTSVKTKSSTIASNRKSTRNFSSGKTDKASKRNKSSHLIRALRHRLMLHLTKRTPTMFKAHSVRLTFLSATMTMKTLTLWPRSPKLAATEGHLRPILQLDFTRETGGCLISKMWR